MNSQLTDSPAAPQFTLRRLLVWMLCLCVALAMFAAMARAVREARRAALRVSSQSPLNQLVLALHNYHDVHGCFPPAYVADQNGKPMHSWRVLILPYIEEPSLYAAYDFTEPWDGPNNSKLASRMPRMFRSPTEGESTKFTSIVAITGPGTAFPDGTSTSLADFADGAENTILLTEISGSQVPWLEPRDIDTGTSTLKVNDPTTLNISAVAWRRPYVVFADSITAYAVGDMPSEALRALATIAGGEPLTRSEAERQGYLK